MIAQPRSARATLLDFLLVESVADMSVEDEVEPDAVVLLVLGDELL